MTDAFRALKDANPRKDASFDASAEELDALRGRVVASDPLEPAASPARLPRRSRTMRIAGFATSAVAVAAVVTALALSAPAASPDKPGAPASGGIQSAYAAVTKAFADTAEAAKSGTIKTTTIAKWPERANPLFGKKIDGGERDGQPEPERLPATGFQIDTTFSWNGDDLQLAVSTDNSPSKYYTLFVGGKYYEPYPYYDENGNPIPGNPKWIHIPLTGQGNDGENPQDWVEGVRADIQGTALRKQLLAAKDLKQTVNDDGSSTFTGTTPAGAIRDEKTGVGALPYVSGPTLKVHDLETPVKLSVTVGADGLIREVHTTYTSDGGDWTYVSTYSNLGSTDPIKAPEPGTVKEWQPRDGRG